MAVVKILSEKINAGWKKGDHVEIEDELARKLGESKEVEIIAIEEKKEAPSFVPEVKPLEVKKKKKGKVK